MALSSLEITNTSTIDEDARVRCAVLKRQLPTLAVGDGMAGSPRDGVTDRGRGLRSDGTDAYV